MDYIKRLPLGTTPLPFNTAPAAAGYRRMHRIEPFRSKQKNSILRDMYLQNYFEEKESLTNLVSEGHPFAIRQGASLPQPNLFRG